MKTRAVRSYDSLPRSRDIALDLPLYSPLLGGGRVLDRSRYRNNGVINGATWSSPYRYFDGVDDYIEAPHSASLSPTDAITLISWIYPTEVVTPRHIIQKGHPASAGYVLGTAYDKIEYALMLDATTGLVRISSITAGTATHIALTWDDATDTIIVYKNGIAVHTSADKPGPLQTGDQPLRIGYQAYYSPNAYFVGGAGEIRVYRNRALSGPEIRHVYEITRWRYQ